MEGVSAANVSPAPCEALQQHDGACPFRTDTLPIDQVTVQQCAYDVPPWPGANANA